jgi:hypothetical protein
LRVRSAYLQGAKVAERRYTYDVLGRLVTSELYASIVQFRLRSGRINRKEATTLLAAFDKISNDLSAFNAVRTKLEKRNWLKQHAGAAAVRVSAMG